jgi:hypothetical protein
MTKMIESLKVAIEAEKAKLLAELPQESRACPRSARIFRPATCC